MPYTPTNCWPHNCAVERNDDGYHFLGTVDKYDTIEDVHLKFYEKETTTPLAIIKNKDMIIEDLIEKDENGNALCYQLSENSTVPPYNYSHSLIDLNISDIEENNSDLNITDIELFQEKKYFYLGQNSSSIGVYYYPYRIKFKLNNNSHFIDVIVKTYIRNSYPDMYDEFGDYPASIIIRVDKELPSDEELKTLSDFVQEDADMPKSYEDISAFIKYPNAGKYNSYDGLRYYWENCNLQISLKKAQFTIGNLTLGVTLNLNVNLGTMEVLLRKGSSGYFYSHIYPASINEIDSDLSEIMIKNDTVRGFLEYLSKTSQFYWNFSLFGNKYDYFIQEGVLDYPKDSAGNDIVMNPSYYNIMPQENVKNGQLLNDKYYIKIKDKTHYCFQTGICKITQTVSGGSARTTTILFNENIGKFLSDNGITELQFRLGTENLDTYPASKLNKVSGSDYKFTLSDSDFILVNKDGTHTQEIYYDFQRLNTYITLHTNSSLDEISQIKNLDDLRYIIRTNEIETQIFQADVVNPRNLLVNFSLNNKTVRIVSNPFFELQKYEIEILKEAKSVFKSPFIYLPIIDYEYQFLFPGEYQVKITTYEKGNYLKKIFIQDFLVSEYNSEQYGIANYDKIKKANRISLSNIMLLPWKDRDGSVWYNGQNYSWGEFVNTFSLNTDILLDLRATIYKYLIGDDGEIIEQFLLADKKSLEPHWNENNSFNFDSDFYDYGVMDRQKYQYEIFYEGDVSVTSYKDSITLSGSEESIKIEVSNDTQGLFSAQILNSDGFSISAILKENDSNYIREEYDGKITIFDNSNNSIKYLLNVKITDNQIAGAIAIDPFSESLDPLDNPPNIEIETHDPINSYITKDILTVHSDTFSINDDWLGVTLYGTKYNKDENEQNRYELDESQVWYFDLDTKADSIDFNTERNVFVNASPIPKIGKSKVSYMTQTITTKLGYLDHEDVYVEDNKNKLMKFAEFANTEMTKILRLRNGLLIPVDIDLKTNTNNYSVVGAPSDISFTWTQIGNYKDSVLYSLEKGDVN